MILIDALYVNNSGGKILLDYLINKLENTDLEIVYLLDKRIKEKYKNIKSTNKVYYLTPTILYRFFFYLQFRSKFNKVLCFGNIPPLIKLNKSTVYTYFHQMLFLQPPQNIGIFQNMVYKLKRLFILFHKHNTTYWVVQSNSMKDLLVSFKIQPCIIKIMPFYHPIKLSNINKKKNTFLYVSSGESHKNHLNLLLAFKEFYLKSKVGELYLTISNQYKTLIDLITKLKLDGIPIINCYISDREELVNLYSISEFVIYPSFTESFGLGVVEAIETNCKVLSSNLSWSKSICIASDYFNPNSIESIACSLNKAITTILPESKLLIYNEIDNLIESLS